ncbi:MAG: DUF6603 domain-containing protein, partial [Bacteroidota bacterium]
MGYDSGKLWLLLDSGLATKALSIELMGFGAGLLLEDPLAIPSFTLNGLGIALQTGSINLSGTFLKGTPLAATGDWKTTEQYDGELGIQLGNFNLTAIGSYAQMQNDKTQQKQSSLFAFAVIDYPLGGPPAFFITGGALGFGYNRALLPPDINGVSTYPLVEAALSPEDYRGSLPEVLQKMGSIAPVQLDEYWLAAGIKFTSYELINSFALATVSFGTKLEIVLLGLADIKVPTNDPNPVAEAQLALEARILPEEGLMSVDAQLTDASYILSKDCKLTGGFAFYVWYKPNQHAGDFVVTLGGYHPRFQKPAHYPDVPRLGFHWDVGEGLFLKGGLYFALTPVCVMAGGDLNATWQSGGIKAWFDLHADLLIFWKPYH